MLSVLHSLAGGWFHSVGAIVPKALLWVSMNWELETHNVLSAADLSGCAGI